MENGGRTLEEQIGVEQIQESGAIVSGGADLTA